MPARSRAVYRDGELIAEQPQLGTLLEVPPEPAKYRVEIDAQRTGPAQLSTRTRLVWQFTSAHTDTAVPQPVSVVRFSPRLGSEGTAPASRPFLVPAAVEPLPGSDAGRPTRLTVAVSYDDGASRRQAPVFGNRYVLLWHPRGDGFVSLRAKSVDQHGNTVEQTIIRAYRIA